MGTRTERVVWRDPGQPGRQGHPSLERLGAYHRGQLTDREQEELREHFLLCRECRQVMLELVEFLDGSQRPASCSAEEIVDAWKELQWAVDGERTR